MKRYILICLAVYATLSACKKTDFLDKTVDLTNLSEERNI